MAIDKFFISPPVCNSCQNFLENHSKQLKGRCVYWHTVVKRTSPICICVDFIKPKIQDTTTPEKLDDSNFALASED